MRTIELIPFMAAYPVYGGATREQLDLSRLFAGATVVDTSGGRAEAPRWPGVFGPAGVQEQGVGT